MRHLCARLLYESTEKTCIREIMMKEKDWLEENMP